MKRVGRYILVFVIFALLMCFIFVFFTFKRERIQLNNDGRNLLEKLNGLEEGDYTFKDGLIYTSSGSLVNDEYLFGGNGTINIDKYGNISFDIKYKKLHICKNKLGNVSVNNSCSKKVLELEINKNNDIISFVSKYDNLYYKISKKDDFSGNWIQSQDKNIVISSYSTGDNYVWFRDEAGILSPTYKFNVECLDVNGASFDKNTFYCMGSKVELDNKEWLVLESKSNLTTLMLADSLIDRFYMCTTSTSRYCFYTKNMNNPYTWNLSYVNYYLNNFFLKELSESTINSLIPREICNEYTDSGCDDNKGCGGYLKEDIKLKGYKCDNYKTSKVRVITYEEYNEVFNNVGDMSAFKGNYWVLNAYGKNVASVVEENGNIFILEDPTKKKEVRPVITIAK